MAVENYELAIIQGQTLAITVALVQGGSVFDLTDYSIAGKIRRKFSDTSALDDLTVTITDDSGGIFTIGLTAAETAALGPVSGAPNIDTRDQTIGVYDIEITLSGVVTRIMQGPVTLSQEATK